MWRLIRCGVRHYVRGVAANRDFGQSTGCSGKSMACLKMLNVFDTVSECRYMQTTAANRVPAHCKRSAGLQTARALGFKIRAD